MNIHSGSLGDPSRFQSLDHLEQALRNLRASPSDNGRVALIVRRGEGGTREALEKVQVTFEEGIPGDAWSRRENRKPDMQIAVMQAEVAELIANGQPIALSGDQLYLALDLSRENLPEGSQLRIGNAIMVVTPMPHNGCRKFLSRFGKGALDFTAKPELRHRNLRGIYLRVTQPGEIRRGDAVQVLTRGSSAAGA